jgi:hypothetical protein
MPFALEQLSQALSIAATPVHPQSINNSNQSTGWVDMQKFQRVMFVADLGAINNGGSITVKMQTSPDQLTPSDVTSGSITALTTSSRVVTLEMRADQVPAASRYVRCNIAETAGQAALVCVIPLAGEGDWKPASKQDVIAVVQQRLVL